MEMNKFLDHIDGCVFLSITVGGTGQADRSAGAAAGPGSHVGDVIGSETVLLVVVK